MPTTKPAPMVAASLASSMEGYTLPVNERQHGLRRLGYVFGLAGAFALAAASYPAETAMAQPAPAKPAPAAKAKKADASAKGDPNAKQAKEDPPEVKAARGVVTITRAGVPVGLGAVLGGDGRILTALSPIGSGNDLEARFADGSTAKLKLGHHDRAWDLALLVPQTGKWTEGLVASSSDPLREDAEIHSFTSSGISKGVAPTLVQLSSRKELIGGDDTPLEDAIELGSRINPMNLGSPLVDENGRVVGIVGRGCMPQDAGKPCIPVAFGVPVQAIKGFLRTVPADAVQPQPFLGIQGTKEQGGVAKGVRILSVAKGSPAAHAKLHGGDRSEGDTILAVGGEPVTSPEELSAAIKKHAIGEKVSLTVLGRDQLYKTVDVVLGAPPEAKAVVAKAPAARKAEKAKPAAAPMQEKADETEPEAEAPKKSADPFSDPM
jgi:serine protease Do